MTMTSLTNCQKLLGNLSPIVRLFSTGNRCSISASNTLQQLCNKSQWTRAISEAEKLLGHPNILQPLHSLPGDSVFCMAGEIRKLLGSNHPLLDITKGLIYSGHNNMHTHGLLMLLMAKAIGKPHSRPHDLGPGELEDVVMMQRHIATITELIHMSHLIHRGVVNLSEVAYNETLYMEDMEFGNKISILFGDYFLANANLLLGNLRNTKVVYYISGAIRDFVEGEFFFEHNLQGKAIPALSTTIKEWEVKTYFSSASLLANSCKSILIVGNFNEAVQVQAFEFGKHLGLAWQIFNELQYFTNLEKYPVGSPFELVSAPVILHLQREQDFFELVRPENSASHAFDYKKIHALVREGLAIKEAEEICSSYVQRAVQLLQFFPPSDARTALENVVHALQVTK